MVPGARIITVGAQGQSNGCGVKKRTWIIIISFPLHLIQMFFDRMEECSSMANKLYVTMYIGIQSV